MTNGSLEMRIGHEIPSEHYEILAAIVNNAWGWLFEVTPDIMRQRLQSGHPFVIAYDDKQPDEQMEGVDLSPYDGQKIPIVFLEMIALTTEGKYGNIPEDYFSLTNSGLWLPRDQNSDGDYFATLSDRLWHPGSEDPDTIIMADLTGTPSRRRVTGEVNQLIDFTNRLFSSETNGQLPFDPNIPHIWTYSPDRRGVIRMHEDNGATDTGHIILQSRIPRQHVSYLNGKRTVDESFTHPLMNTHIMSYRG